MDRGKLQGAFRGVTGRACSPGPVGAAILCTGSCSLRDESEASRSGQRFPERLTVVCGIQVLRTPALRPTMQISMRLEPVAQNMANGFRTRNGSRLIGHEVINGAQEFVGQGHVGMRRIIRWAHGLPHIWKVGPGHTGKMCRGIPNARRACILAFSQTGSAQRSKWRRERDRRQTFSGSISHGNIMVYVFWGR